MERANFPIIEYSPTAEALLEPSRLIRRRAVPEHAVACFFQDVIDKLIGAYNAEVVAQLWSEIGTNPVYKVEVNSRPLAVFHPGVGAPLAAAFLEEVIALGCRKFVACGGAGVLDSTIALGHLLVPVSAVRDEGTSYHYLPPSREVEATPEAVAAIERTLQSHRIEYVLAKTWTTDGIYRETPDRVRLRRDEGCICVEMEAAAFFAIAKFRGVQMGQILYGGDDVGGEVWDGRGWEREVSVRERLFWLAAEAVLQL